MPACTIHAAMRHPQWLPAPANRSAMLIFHTPSSCTARWCRAHSATCRYAAVGTLQHQGCPYAITSAASMAHQRHLATCCSGTNMLTLTCHMPLLHEQNNAALL